uniref:Uncharacterized protein n=1 Tax=Marmota marmota marmota TaxID=9994 RepID=A0A8C6A047_MARMA
MRTCLIGPADLRLAILLPRPPKKLGLQMCATVPSLRAPIFNHLRPTDSK